MKRRVKLTITNLGNDDASAIVGLIPETADYRLETEKLNGRTSDKAPRKRGTTVKLLVHMNVNGDIHRDRASKFLKNLGARNPRAQVSGAITAGYITESKAGTLKLTAEGKTRVKGEG